MNRKRIYLSAFLILTLFLVSACQQPIGTKIPEEPQPEGICCMCNSHCVCRHPDGCPPGTWQCTPICQGSCCQRFPGTPTG